MRKKLSIIAILMITIGFGMVHNPSIVIERASIIMMGIGIAYLIYLLVVSRPKNNEENQN
ncbi:hypothetical protein ACT3CD_09025 [Geofilum sp. OHC36d9]|uniref:hypothetical protein n=1 Tax=Geofilum sp. OHC36d9 TaxID=3458413 RepID=UPI004033A7B9